MIVHPIIPRNLPTKQNLLCDNKSGLEVIRSHNNLLQLEEDVGSNNNVSSLQFVFVRGLGSSYKLVLDTSSVMGAGGRWEGVRRALHRLIHLLPLGSVIR